MLALSKSCETLPVVQPLFRDWLAEASGSRAVILSAMQVTITAILNFSSSQ